MFEFLTNKVYTECTHEKWSEIKDGYQYCEKCNMAITIPKRECEHIWEINKIADITNNRYGTVIQKTIILKCKKCGDLKNHVIGY